MSAMAVLASKCRLGSTTINNWRTWGTVSAGDFFSQPTPQPDQEVMRQQAQGQVVVPADPAAHFVVVHTQFTLAFQDGRLDRPADRKSTRLNSSHGYISYAVFCLKKKKQ